MAAFVVLLLSVSSLWADAAGQAADLAALQSIAPGKTLLNASALDLAEAVASAIIINSSAAITPADLAVSPFQPGAGGVRADINTSTALVAASAIKAVLSGTGANAGAEAVAIADALVDVNPYTPGEELTTGGQSAVVKAALGAISDAAVSNPSLIATDQALGVALAADFYLESLPDGALITILRNAIAGVSGLTGKAQAVAPEAAGEFVAGLVSSNVPDRATLPAFAVAILKKVSKNAGIDEFVAYQIGLKNAVPADLVSLAGVLFAKYPAAAVKITQGIVAAVPAGLNNESGRIAFLDALVAAQARHAVSVIQGAVYVDPYYAGQFTQGAFTSLLRVRGGAGLLVADASRLASGLGATLGQDGNALTQVADVYGGFIGSGALPASSAAAYATALIRGAVKSVVAPFDGAASGGGGGYLNVGPGIAADTVTDLASILDLLANGIITADHSSLSGAGLTNAAAAVGALARAVAKFTKNESFIGSNGLSQPVAAFLAGTLAEDIAAFHLGAALQSVFFAAIGANVTAVTNATVDPQVTAAIKDHQKFTEIGPITVQETTVTNL